jgi:iron(III) transport system ATP-binding protein
VSNLLNVNQISCRYDDNVIIPDLSFSVKQGQIVSLLGPSGSGKTTALRSIAGFEPIYSGEIELAGNIISTAEDSLVPEKRKVGMVFQDYALFPHLTVKDNIAFGIQDKDKSERLEKTADLLDMIKLKNYAEYYPHQLSGGQQQRVALARALAPNPVILLMDEPFSNLDAELRRSLSLEVREILKQNNITAILVTHDQTEALTVADEIGVLDEGVLQQWGTPETLRQHPANDFVAKFMGMPKT